MATPPYTYQTGLRWTAGKKGALSAPPRLELIGGAPPEFGGDDQAWSPEHLLLPSVSLCLMLTFLALADKAKLKVDAYRCQTEGTLDKTGGVIAFTAITVRVELRSPEQQRAETMLQTAKKYCFISNSLKASVSVAPMTRAA
jgi:organic hydroperoxide reductase OsmC/OhrA